MHAGYVFKIKKSDNSINLFVYTWGNRTKDEYFSHPICAALHHGDVMNEL
jgi:hypothetical protein